MPQVNITIKEIMTKNVVYAEVPGSRDDVLKIMKKKGISGLPVVKGSKLVGIVTRQDILRHPEEEQIALLMTRNPITVTPESNIKEAAKLFLNHKIRRLPVVVNSNLVGIVTVTDLIAAMGDMNITRTIEKYIENSVVVAWEGTPLPVVAEIMRLAKVDALPVINTASELVGIISDTDLIKVSKIEDSVEKSDMSAGSDEDAWTWESLRDTMSLYYSVSKIKFPEVPVKEIMVKKVITAGINSEVSDCAKKMKRHKIEQLPVITAHQKITGILRESELIRALLE
ncbi:MAG: CBS domain-containing protein [Halobacteria archaeon]